MNIDFSKIDHLDLHNLGIKYSRALRKCETYLITIIGRINEKKLYTKFNEPSIFSYTEKYYGFSGRKTYTFLDLYKASQKIPELKKEIEKSNIPYSKLQVIKPALVKMSQEREELKKNNLNAEKVKLKVDQIETLIKKTKTNSRRKIEIIAKDIAPQEISKSLTSTYLGNGKIECKLILDNEDYIIFEKAINLLSSELRESVSLEKAVKILSERLLENKLKKGNKKAQIVVEKEENNTFKTTSKIFGELKVNKDKIVTGGKEESTVTKNINLYDEKKKQRAIPNKIKNEVYNRDGGKCKICGKAYKLHFHHITPINDGGKHKTQEITLLCTSCHALHHNSYLDIFVDEKDEVKYKFKNKNITRFTDYLYETKKNLEKNKSLERKNLFYNDKQKLLF